MASTSSGPPGLTRPKSSPPPQPKIFSPTPSPAHKSWFSLLASPCPSPVTFVPPAPAFTMPPTAVAAVPEPFASLQAQSHGLVDNTTLTNIAQTTTPVVSCADPWTRAHVRACAHAVDDCAACSIALICCSCRALRYTPGPPPSSPMVPHPPPPVQRSRSASPALFRNVGNGPPPPGFDSCDDHLHHDDDAFSKALAECDTCDNSSCPRGYDAPATYTIIVEQFDEGSEEFYDRTFRACSACNRSCKKSFLGHRIKSRTFDNSTRNSLDTSQRNPPASRTPPATIKALQFDNSSETLLTRKDPAAQEFFPGHHIKVNTAAVPVELPAVPEKPADSRPTTPFEVFATVARTHRISCNHAFSTCPTCSRGITCCGCNNVHTAPARLKLRCTHCHHYACATCTTPFCCSCRKPWFPTDSPTCVLAARFCGGARSTKSSKKGSSSSSHSSGPGSLASARSQQPSPDPFAVVQVPGPMPTQSSVDEIDALTERTIRISDVTAPRNVNAPERSAHAPSPSSNLPSGPPVVFSRPSLPVGTGATEDIPTAVPSRAPSRAASIRSASSIGDDGIANELQPPPFPTPVSPPAFDDVVGRIHRRFPLASLKVDDEDSRHFLSRDNTRVDDIANETDYLLSSHTTWPTILYFIRDTMKFESIQGPVTDFQVVMSGIADAWSDASSFDARGLLRDMLDASRLLPKAEREIDRLEAVSARYRTERNTVRTQLKTTDSELSRLRQAANDTLDSNARLLTEIDQLRTTDVVVAARERDEAQLALKDAIAHAKTAMAKQVSRYQHLAKIADERASRIQELEKETAEKDTYILNTEREHAEIYREREAAERSVATLKQQLQDATNLFEAAREARRHDQEDFNERTVAFKKHIADLNTRLNLLPSGEMELRSLVTDANERAGIAEEEYRKKSAELKLANKEIASLKASTASMAKQDAAEGPKSVKAPKKEQQAQSSKKVRWSFEAPDESSQPFWDHSNEYSRYIADMVAATVTALPNIPMQTAISTAIETVRAAGPTILSQSPAAGKNSQVADNKRPSSPNLTGSAAVPTQRSRAPSPSVPKPGAAAKAKPSATAPSNKPVASMTFAQMAASVLDPPSAAPIHPAKAKPTWRAIETNKSLVLRPGTKGTRVSELHIRVPKVASTEQMFSFSGTKLINEVLRLVNNSHNRAGIKALKENHIVLAKWSMRGNLIIKCSKPMDDVIKECLHDAFKAAVPPGSADSIAILNKPPTTALKFMTVPRHNEDGSESDSFDLFNDLMAHELWRDVELFSQPRFLPMKPDAAGGTVIVSVVDDNQGTVGRKLMNTVVTFSGASRRCLRWVEKEVQLFCTQCQGWGHLNYNCLSNIMRCSKCSGPHDYRQHDRFCETCKAGKGKLCLPKCHNCHGSHFSSSKDCIFYLNRSSKERQVQLRDEFSQKWKEEAAALRAAANSDSGRAARTANVIKANANPQKGKTKAAPKSGIDDDGDFVPVGKGGKAKYSFGGMVESLASTSRIETVADDTKSDTSSELRLSYLDDVPLKTRFPNLKQPASAPARPPKTDSKPLTITLPASSHRPLRSVTDILRELKTQPGATPATPLARFSGGDVMYTPSAIQAEVDAFASALADSNLPSQPSPTPRPSTPTVTGTALLPDAVPTAPTSQSLPAQHD
ncbi:hypothetical protein AX14_001476 [Amanita brunnescens Koide BX004]|nr:hypothetical protein AX14_001476 [Amanita brunnescens Koide BX004]